MKEKWNWFERFVLRKIAALSVFVAVVSGIGLVATGIKYGNPNEAFLLALMISLGISFICFALFLIGEAFIDP